MRTIATTLAAMLAVLLATSAVGQETTIRVPQGSGVFPTVGQVNCLEESGSGRFCAATYDCSGETGRLWGNLPNSNGRRAINQDSPVARGRDCVITIDGRAAVRWLTAYAPRGRDSELVGLTTSTGALRPVVGASGEGRSLLAYILERHNTTLAEIVESNYSQCDDRPFRERNDCVQVVANGILDTIIDTLGVAADNALNQCLVNTWESYCNWAYEEFSTTNAPFDPICRNNIATAKFLLGMAEPTQPGGPEGSQPRGYTLQVAFVVSSPGYNGVGGRPDITFENYNENVANFPCRNLAEQELAKMGIGVRYCTDGRRWQGGDPAYVDCDSPDEHSLTVLEQEQ